jgi:hypothetical protein
VIGTVQEFYFDDQSWTVRYLIADAGGWLSGRQVLISPYALDRANEGGKVIPVDLTKTRIEKSPSLNIDKPVSRQYEWDYYSTAGGLGIGAVGTLGGSASIRGAGRLHGPMLLAGPKVTIFTSAVRQM